MQPTSPEERIQSLDITRGVAVMGILIMNIWSFGWPREIFDYPYILSHLQGDAVATWAVIHTLFEGSQRALFSILFGAGALLMLRRLEQKMPVKEARRLYRRRTFFLVLFGLFDAYIFLWPADILYVYGLCGFLLVFLRNLKTRSLVILTLCIFIIPTIIRMVEYNHLAALGDGAAYQAEVAKARPDFKDPAIQKSLRIMQDGSLSDVFKKQAVGSLILQTIVTVKWWFMDALGAMLIGMILFRGGVLSLQSSGLAPRRLLLLGYGIGLPVSLWETMTLIASDFDPLQQALTAFTYDIGRLGMAFGHLGLILLFCQGKGAVKVKQYLAAAGQMALSNYLAQSILCGLIFYSFGFGLYGTLAGYQLYYVVFLVWTIEIIWSKYWLARYRFGPFEWLWRSLTYGKAQPMKR